VIGVRVVPAESTNPVRTRRVMEEAVTLLRELDGSFPMISRRAWRSKCAMAFSARSTRGHAESLEAVALAAAHNIHLETTYTGKALAALVADARAGKLAGKTVLFWNTYSSTSGPRKPSMGYKGGHAEAGAARASLARIRAGRDLGRALLLFLLWRRGSLRLRLRAGSITTDRFLTGINPRLECGWF